MSDTLGVIAKMQSLFSLQNKEMSKQQTTPAMAAPGLITWKMVF